jgi:chromosomal replication initiation ATPase DnaA
MKKNNHESLRLAARLPAVRLAIQVVGAEFGYGEKELLGRCRFCPLVRARQLAQYLAVVAGGESAADTARAFGLDHTTVLHSLRAVRAHMDCDDKFRATVERLAKRISEPVPSEFSAAISEAATLIERAAKILRAFNR